MRRRRSNPVILIAALLAVAITTFWQKRGERPVPEATTARVERRAPVPVPPPDARPAEAGAADPLRDVVESDDERAALAETLKLIAQGGPFPYPEKDGTTFGNRERRLPAKPRGYYREYTVPTRGSRDRGARRVVAGRDGDFWYTRDHYRTFTRVDAAAPVR
jgi:ribonuclease T1